MEQKDWQHLYHRKPAKQEDAPFEIPRDPHAFEGLNVTIFPEMENSRKGIPNEMKCSWQK